MPRYSDRLHRLAAECGQEPAPNQRHAADALCAELRDLFCNDVDCFTYRLEVRVHGSVCNNTHLPSSDTDIAVIPTACRLQPAPRHGPAPSSVCDPLKFREDLIVYLKKRYGEHLVCQQHKAILLCGEGGRTQADIVVLIPQLWQHQVCPRCGEPQCSHGYELRSSCDRQLRIATWPDQHRENAAAYDLQTGGRYKQAVRAAKGLLRSGLQEFRSIAPVIPSILVENLFARVPHGAYAQANHCPYNLVKCVLNALQIEFWHGRAFQFQELSDKRPLFDPTQTWTYAQVRGCIHQLHALL